MTRYCHGSRTDEEEIKAEFRVEWLENSRRYATEKLGRAMREASHSLSLIRDRIAELEAMPWVDVVRIHRQKMDLGSIQITIGILHVPVLADGPSFDDGYIIDGLSDTPYSDRSYRGTERHEALRFAEQTARERGLDLYFEGFQSQKITVPEGIICWGLPA